MYAPLRKSSVAVVCTATILIGIVCLPVADFRGVSAGESATPVSDEGTHYGIVIDAGSSGSRVYVYEWPSKASASSLLSVRLKVDKAGKLVTLKTEPGLSSYEQTPQKAYSSLVPLLDLAASHVPSNLHSATNVYVLATAGMRLLPEMERNAILASVYQNIRASYSFKVSPDHIRVLSGQMEGVFGWIAVNYALNTLSTESRSSVSQQQTHGFIEMGGASEQIAFEVESERLPSDLGLALELCPPGRGASCLKYSLYVTTFLGYGANAAYSQYVKSLVLNRMKPIAAGNTRQVTIEDPCQPKGMRIAIKANGDHVELLATGEDTVSPDANAQLLGIGNFASCQRSLVPLLNAKEGVSSRSLGGAYQPRLPLTHKFYGLSEFWYCMEDILGIGGRYDYEKYVAANQQYCGTSWLTTKRLKKDEHKYPKADSNRLRRQCFKAAWLAAVLHHGHHFPKNFQRFESVSLINKSEVQWTLGALVYHLHQPPSTRASSFIPSHRVAAPGSLVYQLLFVVVIASFFIALRVASRRRMLSCPAW